VLEGYQREGKTYVTIAVGCTGGKHRSVATAEELATRLGGLGVASRTVHRDLGLE
jgi:RNase adapter protein RapZ